MTDLMHQLHLRRIDLRITRPDVLEVQQTKRLPQRLAERRLGQEPSDDTWRQTADPSVVVRADVAPSDEPHPVPPVGNMPGRHHACAADVIDHTVVDDARALGLCDKICED